MTTFEPTAANWRSRIILAVVTVLLCYAVIGAYPILTLSTRLSAMTALALAAVLLRPQVRTAIVLLGVGAPLLIFASGAWMIALVSAIVLMLPGSPLRGQFDAFFRSLLTILIATAILLRFEQTGLFWPELSAIAWAVTSTATRYSATPKVLAFHESTLPWLCIALAMLIARVLIARQDRATALRLLFGTVGFAAPAILFDSRMLAAGAVVCVVVFGNWDGADGGGRVWSGRLRLSAAVLCIASVLVMTWQAFTPMREIPARPKLGIVNGGKMTLEVPGREDLSFPEDPIFGTIEWLLTRSGWSVEIIPQQFTAGDLESLTILTVINPTEQFRSSQLEAVEQFVRAGGRLQVLGDHTDLYGIRDPLNQLLQFTSIRYRFDSAIPLYDDSWRWRNSIRGGLGRVHHRYSSADFSISVGASLEVGPEASVLVMGDHAFSDRGRPDFGLSRLGDMQYNPGELRGGLPLVAQQCIDEGIVEVWGDTSSLQPESISNAWKFHLENYRDLAGRAPSPLPRMVVVGFSMIGVLGVAVFCFGCAPWLFTITGTVGVILAAGTFAFARPVPIEVDLQDAVLIDASHTPLYRVLDNGATLARLAGLVHHSGMLCLESDNFPFIIRQHPRTIILVAPTRAYNPREVEMLEGYVATGGRLILFAGAEEIDAVEGLLDRFEIGIDRAIYGAAHLARAVPDELRTQLSRFEPAQPMSKPQPIDEMFPAYDADVQFVESHPLILHESAEELVTCWGRPIAALHRHGEGHVVVVGDARFATKDGLETSLHSGENGYHERNAEFVFYILDR